MRGPEKHITQEDMWATLAKHSPVPAPVKPPEAGVSPKEKLPALQWLEPVKTGANAGYVRTACGQFSISKDSVFGRAMYTAWKLKVELGIRPTRIEAEGLCEAAR
jgi:hypothetical protein